MIFYFSGTGNSRLVAFHLADLLGEREPLTMNEQTSIHLPSLPDEAIGFIFPVYCWGIPKAVKSFLERLPAPNPSRPRPYIYAIFTHGDDIGRTDSLLRKVLKRKGFFLRATFSIAMRNTYVCLPGFDIDSPETTCIKTDNARKRLFYISQKIIRREMSLLREEVTPGLLPRIKTYIIRPIFNRFLVNDKNFRTDTERCTKCGKCKNVCPIGNISLNEAGSPKWNGRCTLCLACYHACPRHAIHYGRFTKNKGQVEIIPIRGLWNDNLEIFY